MRLTSAAGEYLSPYHEALEWIRRHPGTSGSYGLAKLILSVWNDMCCFSFRECIGSLDEERTAIALRVAQRFAEVGEDQQLVDVGHAVHEFYPGLWELARAGTRGKQEQQRVWESERRRDEDDT